MFDVIIIGAGIIGSMIAYKLSKYDLSVLVIDKEGDVASLTTMANSAIIHTGYDPEDNTLKAKLNVAGAKQYEQLCADLSMDYRKCGAYVVSRNEEESKVISELERRAKERGVRYARLTQAEVRKNEPNIADMVLEAISFPDTAVIDPMALTVGLMEVAMDNGTKLVLSENVIDIKHNDTYTVKTNKNSYTSKYVINCAGINSSKIANLIGDASFVVTPRKGEYYVLSKNATNFVNNIIYPVPTKMGKGVLAVPTVHGNVLLGPTAEDVNDDTDNTVSVAGLKDVRTKLETLVKNTPYNESIRSFAGIRAKGNTGDFIIYENKEHKYFINLGGIESPGIASAPAIADYVIESYFNDLKEKENYTTKRRPQIRFNSLSAEEKNELIKKDPKYGKIICRCEKITEAEIVDAIHRNCGATTVKGVKKRVRPGMGKCQGGFCSPLVVNILARELGISPLDVKYDSEDSNILESFSKEGSHE